MKKEPFVSIVICTQDKAEALNKYFFKTAKNLNYSNYEVVVIDDDSKDNTKEIVFKNKSKFKHLRYIKNKKRKGLCYVRQMGPDKSLGEIIAYTDDDCTVDKNWLSEIANSFIKDDRLMVVGGKIFISDTGKVLNQNGNVFGGNMAFRKEIFRKFSFDKGLNFFGSSVGDESDLLSRIKKHNLKVGYNEKAIVSHFSSPTKRREKYDIGKLLNGSYMSLKHLSTFYYYNLLFKFIFYNSNKFKKYSEKKLNINKILFEDMKRLFDIFNLANDRKLKVPYFYLFFIIPIRSKIKHLIEEIKFYIN